MGNKLYDNYRAYMSDGRARRKLDRMLEYGIINAIYNPNANPFDAYNQAVANEISQRNLEDERAYQRSRQAELDRIGAEDRAKERERTAANLKSSLDERMLAVVNDETNYDDSGKLKPYAQARVDNLKKEYETQGIALPDVIGLAKEKMAEKARDRKHKNDVVAIANKLKTKVYKTDAEWQNDVDAIQNDATLTPDEKSTLLDLLVANRSNQSKQRESNRAAVSGKYAEEAGRQTEREIKKRKNSNRYGG